METSQSEPGILAALSNQLADAVEQIAPALVRVNGRQRHAASGIVYAPQLILTADHVLEREEELSIETHDGRTLPAQFVGRDPATDLAVLQVADQSLTPAAMAGSARVGQFVLAVGRPASDGPMASFGIVSAVGGPLRSGRGAMLEQYIRTDAIPYPGFSGGPLIDTGGAVLGILTTGLLNGVALAVPAAISWRIASTLASHGSIARGYLGISCQPVPLPTALRAGRPQEGGLLVVRVEETSPAEQAGLLLGDTLITLDGQAVIDTDDLQALLGGDRIGQQLPLEIIRAGAIQHLQITIGKRTGN